MITDPKLRRAFTSRSCAFLAFAVVAAGAVAAPPSSKGQDNGLPAQVPTNEIIVKMVNGAFAENIAQKHFLGVRGSFVGEPNWIIFRARSVEDALRVEKLLKNDPLVEMAGNNFLVRQERFQAFTPNDPYYPFNAPAGYKGQWHLSPNASNYPSVNAQSAWTQGAKGTGVRIGIVDDCLQINHPDLSPGYDAVNSWDFGQNDADPSPPVASDMHGTSVAGVAGARGGNGIGVTGASPNAILCGLRCDFNGGGTAAMFANATNFHSSGVPANRIINIKNHSYGYTSAFVDTTTELTALSDSAAAGTIHCFAAGNSRTGSTGEVADTGFYMLQGSPKAIVVAALGSNGKYSYYSNFGSNVFVTAPTSDSVVGITTTDRTGADGYNTVADDPFPDDNYTSTFGGTSSASPLVSGVLGLVKERTPAMDVRLAKYLLAKTSKVVDPWDTSYSGGWVTNGAGYRFNRNYGFGVVHAGDLLNESKKYYSMVPQSVRTIPTTAVGAAIPDNNPAGVTRTFSTSGTVGLEEVRVRIKLTHTWSGDVSVWLTSPYGTTSQLVRHSFGSGTSVDNTNWWFTTNAFWGEVGGGTWTIKVADEELGDTGTWVEYQVELNSGGPVSKLGNNILTYNGTAMQMNTVVNAKAFSNVTLPSASAGFKPVAVGDIDGDGRNDILTYNPATQAVEGHLMHIYNQKSLQAIGTLGPNLVPFAMADINKDGRQDIVCQNSVTREIGYYRLTGGGVLGVSAVVGTPPVGMVPRAAVDSTGDGQPDIILDKTTVSRAIVVWQLSPGGAPYGFLFSGYQAAGYDLLNAGDINFDNQPDFLAKNTATGAVAAYTMNILTVSTISTVLTPPAGHTPVGFVAL